MGRANGDRVLIYYEGNHYGFMSGWDEMVLHAADRLITRYPTIACASVLAEELVPVGQVDEASRTVVDITDADALQAWRTA